MSEIIWHDIIMTGNNSSSPYVATASSTHGTSPGPYAAFDGKPTNWMTADNGGDNAWVGIDYGEKKKITHFEVTARSDGHYHQVPVIISIGYSDDEINWKYSEDVAGIRPTASSQVNVYELKDEIEGRYIRYIAKEALVGPNGQKDTGLSSLRYGYKPKNKFIIESNNLFYTIKSDMLTQIEAATIEGAMVHANSIVSEIDLTIPFTQKEFIALDGTSTIENVDSYTPEDVLSGDSLLHYQPTAGVLGSVIVDAEVAPYSVYDYISETPIVIIHNEGDGDVVITTETEPFTIYDEFGDEVEILYYTDDESVTEANLSITANWSPLDELEGDFEIVTWTDEPADTAVRQIKIEGLHVATFVAMDNWIDVENLVGISVAGVTDTFAPFVIQKKNDETLYSYYEGYFFPIQIDAFNLHNYGLTPDIVNGISRSDWQDFLESETELRFHFYFSNRSIGTKSLSQSLDVTHQIGKIQVLREITKSTPSATKVELEASMYSMDGRLELIERINVNNLMALETRIALLSNAIQTKMNEMIIETFDDNQYEVPQYDKNGNLITIFDPSDDTFKGTGVVKIPLEIPKWAVKLFVHVSGENTKITVEDGIKSFLVSDQNSEVVELSGYDLSSIKVKIELTNGYVNAIAYAWE